jgi:hypothetical protein
MGGYGRRVHVRLKYLKEEYVLGKILHNILKVCEARGGSELSEPSSSRTSNDANEAAREALVAGIREALEKAASENVIDERQEVATESKKRPNALLTATGYICPIDGEIMAHYHPIEWFHRPNDPNIFPLVMLWKPEE